MSLFYFTSYGLNMFRTLIYPSPGACNYSVELPHWSYCSWFDVCWSFGVVVLEWYPCCKLQPATRIPLQLHRQELVTILLNYHIGLIVLGSMCVGVSVWLGCSGIHVASFSVQQGYHSNPTTPKLQHTSHQEQYDQCGNSTAQSQAPDDRYINVRNMLSMLKPATQIPLQPNHTETPTHIAPRKIRPMR